MIALGFSAVSRDRPYGKIGRGAAVKLKEHPGLPRFNNGNSFCGSGVNLTGILKIKAVQRLLDGRRS